MIESTSGNGAKSFLNFKLWVDLVKQDQAVIYNVHPAVRYVKSESEIIFYKWS